MNKYPKDTERWKKIVRSFAEVSVTVMADLVADEFVFGEIARVSREAPVLILKFIVNARLCPAAAQTRSMNLASLGVNVLPVGVVGDDEAGSLLLECFRGKKISVGGIERLKNHPTTTKTRILAGMSHATVEAAGRPRGSRGGAAGRTASCPAEPGQRGARICDSVGRTSDLRLRLCCCDPRAC